MTLVVSLNHVTVEFPAVDGEGGVRALDNVSLDFRDNEFVVALGASGNIVRHLDHAAIRPSHVQARA